MKKLIALLLVLGGLLALVACGFPVRYEDGGDGGLAGFANALTIILGVIAATLIALTLV